jgi:PAS domain S-box-containing protein
MIAKGPGPSWELAEDPGRTRLRSHLLAFAGSLVLPLLVICAVLVQGLEAIASDVDRPFGRWFWILLAGGGALGVIGVGVATSLGGRISQSARAIHDEYRGLVQGSIQGMYVHQDFTLRIVNPAMAAAFGYDTPADLVGRDLRELLPPAERPRVEALYAAGLRGDPAAARYELQGVRRDGTPIWLEHLTSVIAWRGEPALLATFMDITERKRAEDATHALAELGRTLYTSLDPRVVAHSDVRVAVLYRLHPESGDLISAAVSPQGVAIHGAHFMVPSGGGAVGLAVRERRPIVSADVTADTRLTLPPELRERLERSGYLAVLAVPLTVGDDRVAGVFALGDRAGRTFTPDQVALAEAFAGHAAVAFENARLHAETEERLRDTELLLSVSQALATTLDPTEVFRRTARAMVRAMGADLAGAWIVHPGGASLSPLAAYRVPKALIHTFVAQAPTSPFAPDLMELRAPLHIEDSARDPRLDHLFLRSIAHRSVLIVPVRSQTETIAGFAVVWVRERTRLSSSQLRLVEAIARYAAVAIEHAGLLEAERASLERLAISEARYQQLFENVNDIVYLHDLTGRLLEVNEVGALASGYTRAELVGMNIATLMPEDDVRRASDDIRRAMEDGSLSGFFATELIRKDGGRVFLEVNARLILKDGRPAAVEGVARNVTARRRSEERHAAFIEIIRELAAEDDFDALISLIGARTCELLATDDAGFVVIEGDELVFRRPIAGSGAATRRQKIADSRLRRVVVTRSPAISEDMVSDPHWCDSSAVLVSGYRAVLEVPVVLRGEVVGVLSALHRTPRPFSPEDVGLLTSLADHTAVAFDRTSLVRNLNARLAEMTGLLTVSRAISSTLDVTETMRRVARETGRMFGADMVGAYLADASEDALAPVAGYHVPKHLLEAFRVFAIPLKGQHLLETAWKDHRSVWSDDLESDPRIDRQTWSRFPHRSALFVPMVVSDRPIGALYIVWWTDRRTFLPSEVQLAEGIARQAAIAIANSRSYDDAERRRREAEELAEVARLLTESLDADTVSRTMVQHVLGVFKADSAILRLLRPDGWLVETARAGCAHPGFASGVRLPPGAGFASRAVREGRPVWRSDILLDPDGSQPPRFREALAATGLRAVVAVPLRAKHTIIGALAMAFTSVRTFSDAEVSLLQAFADQAALALENARLYQDEQEARAALRRLSRRLMEVQEAERRRLAFELHDEIGQSLTALKLNLQLAEASSQGPTVTRLRDGIELADHVLEQVRSLSLDLRPSLLDDLGLSAALRWYVPQQAKRAGIAARVTADIGEDRLPAPIETACFRVVQEAVTNVLRHAHASQVVVDVQAFPDRIELWIEDDGAGFDVAAARRDGHGGRSLGLLSMEERVSLVAGELSIDSLPGRGTRIHVTCPLTAGAPEDPS